MRRFRLRVLVLGGAMALLVSCALYALGTGKPAPLFTLTAQNGTSVSLSSLRGQWVVVFFLSSATDSSSASEVKAFQGDVGTYDKYGTVLGISTDSSAQLSALAAQTGAGFPLLTDPQGKTAKAYGALAHGAVSPMAVLIDTAGNVDSVWTGVTAATASSLIVSRLSLKPPVGGVTPIHTSLKPPIP